MDARAISGLFVALLLLKVLITHYLDKRQRLYILKNRPQVPPEFSPKISLKDHQRAADYTLAKLRASSWFGPFNLAILLSWTLLGGLEQLHLYVASFHLGKISTGVVFFALFGIINMALSLPQSLYSTFVIEEKFGLNRTTLKIFLADLLKSLLLGGLLGPPFVALLLGIMENLDPWWPWAWGTMAVFQLFIIWAYPTVIAPMFNKFSPLQEGEVYRKVSELLSRTEFQSEGLLVMDASKRSAHGNAYFTGLGKNKRIVLFDTLLDGLSPMEVQAILAHEIGHFKKKHILKRLLQNLAITFGGFWILGALAENPHFFQGHGVDSMGWPHLTLMTFLLVSGVYTFFLTPALCWFSRKHEFEADAFAAKHSSAQELISGLVKLYRDNASTLTPDPLYSAFYHSHPPAPIRVAHLRHSKASS